jgi:hypothetical protein
MSKTMLLNTLIIIYSILIVMSGVFTCIDLPSYMIDNLAFGSLVVFLLFMIVMFISLFKKWTAMFFVSSIIAELINVLFTLFIGGVISLASTVFAMVGPNGQMIYQSRFEVFSDLPFAGVGVIVIGIILWISTGIARTGFTMMWW